MTNWKTPWKVDFGYLKDATRYLIGYVLEEKYYNILALAPEAIEILKAAIRSNNESCRADHHGHCQAHYGEPIEECWVAKARALLSKLEGPALSSEASRREPS